MTCTEWGSNGDGVSAMKREIARYMATGESDQLGSAFPGSNVFERLTNRERPLREALLQEVQRGGGQGQNRLRLSGFCQEKNAFAEFLYFVGA